MSDKKPITSTRKSLGYVRGSVWKEFDTKEKREALGIKCKTAQGFRDLLDINKLVVRYSPQQLQELAQRAQNAKYGVQSNKSLRDLQLEIQNMQTDFMELPAMLREHFRNDKFLYYDFLNQNKNNKYVLDELLADISKSDLYKLRLEKIKRDDEAKKNAELQKQDQLSQSIAKAINSAKPPDK